MKQIGIQLSQRFRDLNRLLGGAWCWAWWLATVFCAAVTLQGQDRMFEMERTVAHTGFDGKTCWVHARAGAIPSGATGNGSQQPIVIMTTQKLLLTGSDVFYRLHQTQRRSGETWTPLKPIAAFQRQAFGSGHSMPTGVGDAVELLKPGDETTVCDFTPKWHGGSERLLGIGQTVWYRNNRVFHSRPRGIAYAVLNPRTKEWTSWDVLKLPDEARFQNAGSGSAQRVDLPGGDILLPFYFREPKAKQYSVAVCRCRFDGRKLYYVKHGNEMTIAVKRGLYEPSLTCFQGRYYLTLRNDEHGYVAVSDDGLNFQKPVRWTFDDGSELGNYNTQQHWITHSDKLYLAYTRRGANNDHVFRHRAPLFIGEVNVSKLSVVRSTEQILVEEKGARLGNFGVTDVSENETWVTVAEWMQPRGVQDLGSDNRIHVVKLKWKKPNRRLAEIGCRAGSPQDGTLTNRSNVNAAPNESTKKVANEPTVGRSSCDWNLIEPYFSPPSLEPVWQAGNSEKNAGRYSSLLRPAGRPIVTTSTGWEQERRHLAKWWSGQLGQWPPLLTDQQLTILSTEKRENFTQHKVRFRWTPNEQTNGYLLVPPGDGPHPAVITVYYEPETAIGMGKAERDYALQLTRRGFVTLSLGTTKATDQKTYSIYYPRLGNAKVQPLSMLACAAANAWHVLANRPEVDSERIGIVGHSFGGKWSMFAACQFEKFACAVWSDPGIVFDDDRPSINYWEPWYLGYHPQPWRNRGLISKENPARGLYPSLRKQSIDLHQLHALMAPRPFLVSGGSEDPIQRWEALRRVVEVNRLLGYENRVAMTNRPDHSPNADSNEIVYRFFQHFLQPATDRKSDH